MANETDKDMTLDRRTFPAGTMLLTGMVAFVGGALFWVIIKTGSLRMTRPEDIGFLFRLVDFLPYIGIILMIASVMILYKTTGNGGAHNPGTLNRRGRQSPFISLIIIPLSETKNTIQSENPLYSLSY